MKLPAYRGAANSNARPTSSPATDSESAPQGATTSRTESLGTELKEGVMATGTRTTVTVAVGAQGNDQPVTYTIEMWYSPDLKMEVFRKSEAPDTYITYVRELINLSRQEPDPALFQVPADYKVIDEETGFRVEASLPTRK
jgi:hypothetical protein